MLDIFSKKKKKVESGKQATRKEMIARAIAYYRKKPDKFIEEILEIKLNLYQKILVRAFFRYKYSMWILSRGLGKSWLGALCLVVYCMLYKGTLAGIIAPSFRQGKIVLEDKIIKDLMDRSAFLRSEVKKIVLNMAEARVEFYNGSRIIAVPTGDGNKIRGFRFHLLMCDEYAQIKKEILDLCVNPMMNVKRGYEVGKTDYDDSLGNRLLITSSAYYRHNHLYALFKQYVSEMAAGNRKYFVITLPYQVGIQVGLFDTDHIEKEKKRLSPVDFDMEYSCVFPNMSENAWIDPKDLDECSSIIHIEVDSVPGAEYIWGLDVARVAGQDNTAIQIVKLVWKKSHLEKHLIYTLTLNGEKFEDQAHNIRQLLKKFPNTINIFMDTQTIGKALADELSKDYWDFETQKFFPPLIDINDADMCKKVPNGVKLIYGMTPTAENNHLMGMAVKSNTQKGWLKMYSLDAGDDKFKRKKKKGEEEEEDQGIDWATAKTINTSKLTEEEERLVLEAEATRREVLRIESKPNGMYLKFEPPAKSGQGSRKDRWSALGLVLRGAEIIEAQRNGTNDIPLCGKTTVR